MDFKDWLRTPQPKAPYIALLALVVFVLSFAQVLVFPAPSMPVRIISSVVAVLIAHAVAKGAVNRFWAK